MGIHTKGFGAPLKLFQSSESNGKISQTTHTALLRNTAPQNYGSTMVRSPNPVTVQKEHRIQYFILQKNENTVFKIFILQVGGGWA